MQAAEPITRQKSARNMLVSLSDFSHENDHQNDGGKCYDVHGSVLSEENVGELDRGDELFIDGIVLGGRGEHPGNHRHQVVGQVALILDFFDGFLFGHD